jgi:hypothetical protein
LSRASNSKIFAAFHARLDADGLFLEMNISGPETGLETADRAIFAPSVEAWRENRTRILGRADWRSRIQNLDGQRCGRS